VAAASQMVARSTPSSSAHRCSGAAIGRPRSGSCHVPPTQGIEQMFERESATLRSPTAAQGLGGAAGPQRGGTWDDTGANEPRGHRSVWSDELGREILWKYAFTGRYHRGPRETLLYRLKAGPAGGRRRRPPSRRQHHDGYRDIGLTLQDGGAQATRRTAGHTWGMSHRRTAVTSGSVPIHGTRRARSTPRPCWSSERQDAVYRLDRPGTAPTVLTGVAASPAGVESRWCRCRWSCSTGPTR
jgi:hypothetical protein